MNKRNDGLLIVDKPEGITSLGVVKEIKTLFSIKKAGHIGTLDPFATGVLPIVINEGTKLVPFLEEGPKEYEAVMKLGEETDTEDLTGKVISRRQLGEISPERIGEIFKTFVGKIRQRPPMFSALKVNGKPLYCLARKGIEIERREREVNIFDIKVERIQLPFIYFRVSCSKGTYIRTLTKEVGRKIGCGGYLLQLRRIRSGSFTIEQSVSLERLRKISVKDDFYQWLIPLEKLLCKMTELVGDVNLLNRINHGMGVKVRELLTKSLPEFRKGEYLRMSSPEGRLVAILRSEIHSWDLQKVSQENVALRPLRVFHPQLT